MFWDPSNSHKHTVQAVLGSSTAFKKSMPAKAAFNKKLHQVSSFATLTSLTQFISNINLIANNKWCHGPKFGCLKDHLQGLQNSGGWKNPQKLPLGESLQEGSIMKLLPSFPIRPCPRIARRPSHASQTWEKRAAVSLELKAEREKLTFNFLRFPSNLHLWRRKIDINKSWRTQILTGL